MIVISETPKGIDVTTYVLELPILLTTFNILGQNEPSQTPQNAYERKTQNKFGGDEANEKYDRRIIPIIIDINEIITLSRGEKHEKQTLCPTTLKIKLKK